MPRSSADRWARSSSTFHKVCDGPDFASAVIQSPIGDQRLFTDPEFARVGLTETEVKARNIPHRLVKVPMTSVLRALTYSEPRGFLKAILDESSDQILGFSAFGPEVGEVLGTVQMAMIAGLPFTAIRDAVLTHPTMVEGLGVLFSAVPSRKS
jgi:pyruvate/2-oxoglutarate dehydrogenase complex dihydrolipoamide dehydrogenase (E3) component